MSYSHSTLIERFKDGKVSGSSSSMFIDGDTLYSFGYHFPLMVRMPHWGKDKFILNADKYSITTSQHQSRCFSTATIQVPFSALINSFNGNIKNNCIKYLNLIDKSEEVWEDIKGYIYYHNSYSNGYKIISEKEYMELSLEEKYNTQKRRERRPEAAVLEFKGRYFLSSMDENSYFISELPNSVCTVNEAFEALKPKEVFGQEFIRQGEWFFVEIDISKKEAKKTYKILSQNFILPKRDNTSNSHVATRGGFGMDISFDNGIPEFPINARTLIVSGQIHHPEHKMTRLSTLKDIKLFAAFENNAVNSWSALGNID